MTETHADAPSSYAPPEGFAAQANAGTELYQKAEHDRLAFWAEQANRLTWATPFSQVLDWSEAPFAKWFVDGKLNVAYNCVDRHVEAGHGGRVAIHWEGEQIGDGRTLTYSDLQDAGVQGRQRVQRPGVGRRRPGRHLYADDPRSCRRDVGLRTAGRDAQRGVRGFHCQGLAHPHRRRGGQVGDYHRRAVSPRQGDAIEGRC